MTPVEIDEHALEGWGVKIGASINRPAVIALEGPLGAGKSTLARAIAKGAGVDSFVPSPTYNLAFRYETSAGPFVHVDLYRLQAPAEVLDLGWEEMFEEDGIVVIEWPQRAGPFLPSERWSIELGIDPGDPGVRHVEARAEGSPPPLPPLPPPPREGP